MSELKAEIKTRPHREVPGALIVEVFYGGQLLGHITGADGPGVRFVTNRPIQVSHEFTIPSAPGLTFVDIMVNHLALVSSPFKPHE